MTPLEVAGLLAAWLVLSALLGVLAGRSIRLGEGLDDHRGDAALRAANEARDRASASEPRVIGGAP